MCACQGAYIPELQSAIYGDGRTQEAIKYNDAKYGKLFVCCVHTYEDAEWLWEEWMREGGLLMAPDRSVNVACLINMFI